MNLAETQCLFWTALHGEISAEETDQCFVGTPELPASERVEIYENMYLWRLVDALRDEFPKVAALLGEDDFFSAATAYIEHFPSESPDIGQMGRALATFFKEFPGDRSDLADLAALERARSEVFLEASADPIGADSLASVSQDMLQNIVLRFVPALQVLSFDVDPLPVWQAIEDGTVIADSSSNGGHVAVWRSGFEVFHTALSSEEAEALRRAQDGRPLADVCDAFVAQDDAATAALGAIGSWFREGWVTAIKAGRAD